MAQDQKRRGDFSRALCMLAKERLTRKQKAALLIIAEGQFTASALASEMRVHADCAESTAWDVISSLRRSSLIESEGRGSPLALTTAGYRVVKVIQ